MSDSSTCVQQVASNCRAEQTSLTSSDVHRYVISLNSIQIQFKKPSKILHEKSPSASRFQDDELLGLFRLLLTLFQGGDDNQGLRTVGFNKGLKEPHHETKEVASAECDFSKNRPWDAHASFNSTT